MRLLQKVFKHLPWNKRDDNIPQSRPDKNPSLEPSPEITSTNLIAAPPSQVGSLIDPSSSTTPIQKNSNNRTQQATDEGADNKKKNYWQLAIDMLRDEDTSFSKAITSLQQAAAEAGCGFTDQLLKSTEQAHERVISRRWEFKFGDKTIVPRDQLTKVVAVIDLFKDLGNVASSLESVLAGLPWAGFCVLLQLATSDSEQYMAMVTGAEEVATVILRYKSIEELYMSRPETDLKKDFATRLISLYMNIIKYQIAVTCYYGRNTILRFLRAIPKLDDVSDIIKAIRQEDATCQGIAQVFESQDSSSRHQELLTILDRSSEPHSIPWTVPRPVNLLFMGRREILRQIEEAIRRNLGESDHSEPCRIVITGMGGQGKSEICLQIADRLRNLFQGVFWVDVSTVALAEIGFSNIAKAIHIDAKNLEEARLGLSTFPKPWLLVLDNADDPSFDYQAYLPTGRHGVVLMTSRNSECSRFATVLRGDLILEGLDDDSARALLLKTADISPDQWTLYADDAQAICALLQSHPLALIQAGSYVGCGCCKLKEYPEKFHRRRKRLLEFCPKQGQSRYGHVYATFEASAEVLESSSDEAARDALDILSMLSMIGHSLLPLAIFEATWDGAQEIKKNPPGGNEISGISEEHVEQLISLFELDEDEWDPYRLMQAISRLTSLSLITAIKENNCFSSISIHPLTHAWAKERQPIKTQYESWISTGSVFAISSLTDTPWIEHERQLKPHLQAYLDSKVKDMLNRGPRLMVIQIVMNCARLLTIMSENSRLPSLLEDLFKTMNLDNKTVYENWKPLYQLYGINLAERGKLKEAISLLEELVKNEEKVLDPEHPSRRASLYEFAQAYRANGPMKEEIPLLQEVVRVEEEGLDPDHPSRLASERELARAYRENGQIKEAILLLENVVEIEKETLDLQDPDRLVSQHSLATAYIANGQAKEAIPLLQEILQSRERSSRSSRPKSTSIAALLGSSI